MDSRPILGRLVSPPWGLVRDPRGSCFTHTGPTETLHRSLSVVLPSPPTSGFLAVTILQKRKLRLNEVEPHGGARAGLQTHLSQPAHAAPSAPST